MFNKRGGMRGAWWFMIDLVFVVVLFFLLTTFIDNVGESTTFEKNFLARDVSLLLDSLYTAPSNVEINYPQDTFWFDFRFEENTVQVFDATQNPDPPLTQRAFFPFMEDRNLLLEYQTVSPEEKAEWKKTFLQKVFPTLTRSKPEQTPGTEVKLQFVKTTDGIAINKKLNTNKLTCPIAEVAKPTKVILMPQTGDLAQITQALSTNIENSEKADYVPTEMPDMIIKINQKDQSLQAKIKPNSQQSRKLACLILNNLLDLNPELKPTIVPSEEPPLTSAIVAVSLYLDKTLIEDQKTIIAISKAFQQYLK
ncbi:hypothetical protein KY331_02025 [Candidatus Woesearchaeota archaeon]|nr:hypothetical protein [Candidatus Woesearchaeota archaeon]